MVLLKRLTRRLMHAGSSLKIHRCSVTSSHPNPRLQSAFVRRSLVASCTRPAPSIRIWHRIIVPPRVLPRGRQQSRPLWRRQYYSLPSEVRSHATSIGREHSGAVGAGARVLGLGTCRFPAGCVDSVLSDGIGLCLRRCLDS